MSDRLQPGRRRLIAAAASSLACAVPLGTAVAQQPAAAAGERRFEPRPGAWRRFEVTTAIELQSPRGASVAWVPLPSIDAEYQRTLDSTWTGNARSMKLASDSRYGARMLMAEFDDGTIAPRVQVTSVIDTRGRGIDWQQRKAVAREDAATLRSWTVATELMPTDGIVRDTARKVTQGAKTDLDKVRALYDWVVVNTYREPKVRGCGTGDIKTMLETGNFGGKCGDINALFVGLARAVGVPARDVYGIRLAPSAFGYRELGGNPASLKSAQHCRAEVWLDEHGWVAMDPADVTKVMRLETGEWIKDAAHPVVAPVKAGLFGGWEGNWMAYNLAHDVALPGSRGPRLGFLMYPQAEHAGSRIDCLAPDDFKYTISAREIAV